MGRNPSPTEMAIDRMEFAGDESADLTHGT